MSVRMAFGGVFVMASMSITLAGCGSDEKVHVRIDDGARAKPAPAVSPHSAPAPETSALAAQSQRDVDAILKTRAAANQRASDQVNAPASSSTPNADKGAPQPQKAIVWNEQPRKPAAKDHASDAQPPLGRVSAESINPIEKLPTPPATQPALEPDRLKKLMVDLSRELYSSGAYSKTPLRELMVIASMSMLDPQRRLQPAAIPDLTEKERELLGKLQTFFADLGAKLDGAPDSEQAIIEAVNKLRETLVKEPVLKLPTMSLCTRVGGFGDFSPFTKNTFLAGSEQKVIVYLEIDEFTSELNPKNEYVTELGQQLTIYSDRDGIPVWKEDWQTAVDKSKNKRQDFFTVQVITIPKALSVGKYQLKVRVRDQKSQAEAEGSITFEMVADPKMAAGISGK